MDLRFLVCNAITRARLGYLDLNGVTFNDPLREAGQFSATVSIPNRTVAEKVSSITTPDATALYVIWKDRYILWGGPITSRVWNRRTEQLTITASQWESWFFTRLITPNADNTLRDASFTWTSVDQFQIAQSLIAYATSAPDSPSFPVEYATSSGVLRDASWQSSSFQEVGTAINTVSRRAGGFEWVVDYRFDDAQRPQPYVAFYFPERQSIGGPYTSLILRSRTRNGRLEGNIFDYSYPEDAAPRRSRVWATGEGQPPDQLIRNAMTTTTGTGRLLYRETVSNYPDVKVHTTLDGHARLEAKRSETMTALVTVQVTTKNPILENYLVGDRTRLVLEDAWLSVDLPAVRIVERTIRASSSYDPMVELTLDVTDFFGPLVEV